MSVHGPLVRRVGIWTSKLEVIPTVYRTVDAADIVVVSSSVAVNETITATLTLASPYGLDARGTVQEANGVDVESPALRLAAFTGPQARLTSPALTVSATATVPGIGRATLTLPALSLVANGTISGLSRAQIQLPDAFVVRAFSGAQFNGVLRDRYSVTSNGLSGHVGGAQLNHGGFYVINASGTGGGVAIANLTLPNLQTEPSAIAILTMEPLFAYATGYASSVLYEAYAVNISNGAVTRYTNFPFSNIVRLKDRHFVVSDAGIFELSGSMDKFDNNTEDFVPVKVRLFETTMGVMHRKRVPWVYVSGRMERGGSVTVAADEGTEYTYATHTLNNYVPSTYRIQPGRGISGMYYTFELTNPNGGRVELDRIEVLTEVTSRGF